MERPSSEVWRQPAGARKSRGRILLSDLGPVPPTYDLPAHSGLGGTEGDNAPRLTLHAPRLQLQGPGANLHRATAMKPWKTSCATNETRSACPSFGLDPQWCGHGPILPQGTSRKPETGSRSRDAAKTRSDTPFPRDAPLPRKPRTKSDTPFLASTDPMAATPKNERIPPMRKFARWGLRDQAGLAHRERATDLRID